MRTRVFAKICMKSHEVTGYDNVMAGWGDLLIEAQALGSTWKFPERDFYPRMEKHVISEPGDIDKLMPVDPTKDKYWSVPLRAAEILQKKIGNEVAVVGAVDTPLIVCSELRGYENLLMDMVNRPELVEQIINIVVESEIMYGEALEKIGIETVFMEEGMAGGNQLGPDVRGTLRYRTC